jgi:hypothetical protein
MILKDECEFTRTYGSRLFSAHFAGYWEGDMFHVRKDRLFGCRGKQFTSEELIKHLNHYMEAM